MGINPSLASNRRRSLLRSISKELWLRKESSALSSSLSSPLLQHLFHGREGANHNHFVTASTPSLGLAMPTGETQSPSVGPVGLASAMFPAMLTVATSNQLPPHQGASLSTPVMCKGESSYWLPRPQENRFCGCAVIMIIIQQPWSVCSIKSSDLLK